MQLEVLNNKSIGEYSGDLSEDLKRFPTIKSANEIIYGASKPSKMPGDAYGIPASRCKTGGKLRNVEGSVCFGCYAADDWEWLKQTKRYSNYAWKNVKNANEKRFNAIHHPLWVPAMIGYILRRKVAEFRWHDTGDLQSVEHLENIAKVCRGTPDTKHWLPSREYATIKKWRESYEEPDNLCIRASAHMHDKQAPKSLGQSSMVVKDEPMPEGVFECEAYKRNAECGPCRACWDKSIETVGYPYH